MAQSHYKWTVGQRPPLLKRHSEVKHALLRQYLVEYFVTLFQEPRRRQLRLTIVDGFCGGGLYLNEDGIEVPGSPLVILQAINEALMRVNVEQDRRKAIDIDCELICIDSNASAIDHLRHVLEQRGYGEQLRSERVRLIKGQFSKHCDAVVQRAHDRSKQSGRALFVLDQYGYKAVPMHCLHAIFAKLKAAEVILTFYVDALLTYLNDENLTGFENATGIRGGLTAAELDHAKESPHWRVHLQSSLYKSLTSACSAQFFTPFFVRPLKGHGDFWLLHLSQHWKARDVMASTHWSHHNHFAHYGGPGLDMFSTGYITRLDADKSLQQGFDFSDAAASMSTSAMLEQIPALLRRHGDGLVFSEFFMQLINGTPATRTMVEAAMLQLNAAGEIEIVGDGGVSTKRMHLKPGHLVRAPKQIRLL